MMQLIHGSALYEQGPKLQISILIDMANIVYANSPSNSSPQKIAILENWMSLISQLNDVIAEFSKIQVNIVTFCDARIRYEIDKREEFNGLIASGQVNLCPKGTQADTFMIEYLKASSFPVFIISNDFFNEYKSDPALRKPYQWRISYMVVGNSILLPELRKEIEKIIKSQQRNQSSSYEEVLTMVRQAIDHLQQLNKPPTQGRIDQTMRHLHPSRYYGVKQLKIPFDNRNFRTFSEFLDYLETVGKVKIVRNEGVARTEYLIEWL